MTTHDRKKSAELSLRAALHDTQEALTEFVRLEELKDHRFTEQDIIAFQSQLTAISQTVALLEARLK